MLYTTFIISASTPKAFTNAWVRRMEFSGIRARLPAPSVPEFHFPPIHCPSGICQSLMVWSYDPEASSLPSGLKATD